ncbi:MAG: hypothetical protein KDB27_33630 [Planctomycetales bacterium]|nr:hypothetical protein [Planctomycetales bacterium]
MLQPTFFAGDTTGSATPPAEPSMPITLLFSAAFGVLAGALFGFSQWLVLRKHTELACIWIPANSLGWAAALAIIYLGATLPDESCGIWQILLLGTLTGSFWGPLQLAIGSVTGFGLVRILRAD